MNHLLLLYTTTITLTYNYFACIEVDNNKDVMDPDDIAKGVPFWKTELRMDELCEFLAYYARQVHSKRYYRSALLANPGSTFLDIITASDVAYAVSLIKNGRLVWLDQLHTGKGKHNGDEMDAINEMMIADDEEQENEEQDDEEQGDEDKEGRSGKKTKKKTTKKTTKKLRPLFTAGQGTKRTFGITTWNDKGKEYFKTALENWKPAFKPNHIEYKVLRRHWDRWLETEGRDMNIELDGIYTKNIYDILRPREEGEVVRTRPKKRSEPEDDEEYEYTSDAEVHAVDVGGWSQRRSMCDDGASVRNGGDDDDDNDDEFLSSTSKEPDNDDFEETGKKKEGGGHKAPPVEEIGSSDDSDEEEEEEGEGEPSANLFQMEIEKEAKKAGMENAKKKGGNKTVAKSTKKSATTRPKRNKRGKQAPELEESPRRKSERSNLGTKKSRYE